MQLAGCCQELFDTPTTNVKMVNKKVAFQGWAQTTMMTFRKETTQNLPENWVSKQSFFCFDIDNGLKNIFFRNKTFLFFKIESWNFQVHFEIEFHETLQNFSSIRQTIKKFENNNCLNNLNELKFCEVSRNSFSNRCWKFQLYNLKHKKVLFLK